MAKKKSPSVKVGDHVEWETSQGKTQGRITRKVTGTAQAGGHTAEASEEEPQFEVKSDKSGKTAIHKPSTLKKKPKEAGGE